MVALQVPEMCFWLGKTRKKMNFLRCIHVFNQLLKIRSDTNERNWPQLLFCFSFYWRDSFPGSWKELSLSVFQVLDWSFLISLFCGKFCNWIPELISSQMDWFWSFLFEYSSWPRLRICRDLNLRQLLNYFSFLTT